MAAFWRRKAQRLARADGSRKGALDPGAAAVVRLLNGRAPFCTTSSCSGRLVLAQGGGAAGAGGCGIHKQNCTWLMVAHGTCPKEEVLMLNGDLQTAKGYVSDPISTMRFHSCSSSGSFEESN